MQDKKKLESVQRLWTRHVLGLETKEYGELLKALDLFSVEGRLLRADLVKCWKIFHGLCPIQPAALWDIDADSRTRGHRFKLKVNRCEIDARARFFTNRVIRDWNSLPEWVVGAETASGDWRPRRATVETTTPAAAAAPDGRHLLSNTHRTTDNGLRRKGRRMSLPPFSVGER